jgi:hypothetical protein
MANTPTADLPPREQLELFGQSGQGAFSSQIEQDMAKKSEPKKKPARGGAGGGGGGGAAAGGGDGGAPRTSDASLEAEARRRYLNYALSVITSPTTRAHFTYGRL